MAKRSAWDMAFEGTPYTLHPPVAYRSHIDWELAKIIRAVGLLHKQYKWLKSKAIAYGDESTANLVSELAQIERGALRALRARASAIKGK